MYNICVFAGTTEGRRLVLFLVSQQAKVTACVATEYGEILLPQSENLTVRTGRLNAEMMEELFVNERFDLVIDATHPYAEEATLNIALACAKAGTEYLRLEREEDASPQTAVCVADAEEAVAYLDGTVGNVLLTTGSKELPKFAAMKDFSARAFARVLPVEASVALCRDTGLMPSHILAMQGPFSVGMNAAMIKAVNAAYVVTKDSGRVGGFEEKAIAAKKAGATLVVIGRPESRAGGLSFGEVAELLEKRFGFAVTPSVAVVGVGAGARGSMTADAEEAIRSADCIIGASRMIAAARPEQAAFEAVSPDAIAGLIAAHKEYSRFAVVMSGDTGFFSGAKKLLPKLAFCDVSVIPGISSLSYLCAKLGVSYEDVKTVSCHGRSTSAVPFAALNRRVFALVGGENGAGKLAKELTEAGLGDIEMTVGERLSYPDEQITTGKACELAGMTFDQLSSVLIENPSPKSAAPGLPDGLFLRNAEGDPVVPMTKSEVRAVVMSKLRVNSDSVVWDIGAGTGSVSVEAALAALSGSVYAVEKKPEAAELIRRNAASFGLSNITTVEGTAPEALRGLPAPTHAFIGGSSGNIREIVELLLDVSPNVRIVAAAISLETVAELGSCMKEHGFTEAEAVSVSVARAKRVGGYNLMTGQNPVWVFTMQRK